MTVLDDQTAITNWQQFRRVTQSRGCNYLQRLDDFPNSILVAGCQRSGTTMLARIITQSEGMVNYWFGPDDELDAALILGGYVEHEPQGRYCFQTTYVDNCYHEYYKQSEQHKIVWVLRNPFSVIYSLLYNWPSSSLDYTFQTCGSPLLTGIDRWLYRFFGIKRISRIVRASLVYNAKVSQLLELVPRLGANQIMVVEYDELVRQKESLLPQIYSFINLAYQPQYAEAIHPKSLNKASLLNAQEITIVRKFSEPVYQAAKQYLRGAVQTRENH